MGKPHRIIVLAVFLLLIFGLVLSFVYIKSQSKIKLQKAQNQTSTTASTTLLVTPSPKITQAAKIISSSQRGEEIIDQLPLWAPDIHWQDPIAVVTVNGREKSVSGSERTGTGISPTDLFTDILRIHEELHRQGWETTGPADAPGFSSYSYTKTEDGKQRVIILTYKTKASVISKEPIRFAQCPCPFELMVFYNDPF